MLFAEGLLGALGKVSPLLGLKKGILKKNLSRGNIRTNRNKIEKNFRILHLL